MIGLALVTLVAVARRRHHSSFRGAVEQDLAERRLRDHRAEQLLADPARRGRRGREGARASRRSATSAPATPRAFGKPLFATAVDPAGADDVQPRLEARARSATMATLGDDGAFVDKDYAKSHHLSARLADRR